jgi:hypothetical protein
VRLLYNASTRMLALGGVFAPGVRTHDFGTIARIRVPHRSPCAEAWIQLYMCLSSAPALRRSASCWVSKGPPRWLLPSSLVKAS